MRVVPSRTRRTRPSGCRHVFGRVGQRDLHEVKTAGDVGVDDPVRRPVLRSRLRPVGDGRPRLLRPGIAHERFARQRREPDRRRCSRFCDSPGWRLKTRRHGSRLIEKATQAPPGRPPTRQGTPCASTGRKGTGLHLHLQAQSADPPTVEGRPQVTVTSPPVAATAPAHMPEV